MPCWQIFELELSRADKLLPFEQEAIRFVLSKVDEIKFKTVILDDWSGIRLIYETEDVLLCSNICETCKTYSSLGQDQNQTGDFLITSLVQSSPDHTDVPRNRMLNCKTKSDYMKSFSEWLIKRCHTENDFYEELVLIRDFRVVFSDICKDNNELLMLEQKMKREIVQSAMSGIHGERKALFERMVGKVIGNACRDIQPVIQLDLAR